VRCACHFVLAFTSTNLFVSNNEKKMNKRTCGCSLPVRWQKYGTGITSEKIPNCINLEHVSLNNVHQYIAEINKYKWDMIGCNCECKYDFSGGPGKAIK